MIGWILATVAAFFVKGLCGFANTPVFTSVLSLSNINNVDISPVDLMIGYPANIVMALRERRSIRWRVCLPLILLVLAGSIPGVLFLKNADTRLIRVIFGCVVILVAIEMMLRLLLPGKLKENKGMLFLIGILSGVLCGLYGIGALLSGYIGRVSEDTHAFKANICMVFLAENTFRIITYAVTGILTWAALKQATCLLPFMLAGMGLGMLAAKKIPETPVKILVIVMLAVSGVMLIVNH